MSPNSKRLETLLSKPSKANWERLIQLLHKGKDLEWISYAQEKLASWPDRLRSDQGSSQTTWSLVRCLYQPSQEKLAELRQIDTSQITEVLFYRYDFRAGFLEKRALPSLKRLSFERCQNLSLCIFALALLELLSLSQTELDDIELRALDQVKGLTHLSLSRWRWESSRLLSSHTKLTHLSLRGCSDLQEIEALSQLKELTWLDLGGCESLSDLSALRELVNLKTLNLSGCQLDDISVLEDLPELQHLCLAYSTINERPSAILRKLTRRHDDPDAPLFRELG